MKAKSLTIKNVGLIEHEQVMLDKSLILFYGEIRQGKTTFLNCVRWVCGGSYPADIIRHGAKEAAIELLFDGGSISRSWYVGKDGTTKDRPVVFVRDGRPVPDTANEVKKLLNPYLSNQDYLRNMKDADRKQYFVDLFGVDTRDLDADLFACDSEARDLRAKIKGYGNIDITPVDAIDATALKARLAMIRSEYATECEKIQADAAKATADHEDAVAAVDAVNAIIRTHNSKVQSAIAAKQKIVADIADLEKKIADLRNRLDAGTKWLEANPSKFEAARPAAPILPLLPPAPDTSELEAKISEAAANAVRFEQYQRNVARDNERKADELELMKIAVKQREIKAAKTAKLKTISETCGIPDLSFDEDGSFMYQATSSGMLSTSQLLDLSSRLSGLYPPGLSIELLDKAESLGKSIFGYVDRAKAKQLTIIASIVGERPATAPEEIGVYVVENGKLQPEHSNGNA